MWSNFQNDGIIVLTRPSANFFHLRIHTWYLPLEHKFSADLGWIVVSESHVIIKQSKIFCKGSKLLRKTLYLMDFEELCRAVVLMENLQEIYFMSTNPCATFYDLVI